MKDLIGLRGYQVPEWLLVVLSAHNKIDSHGPDGK